jgi:predicted metal-dependent HD superfamily phosphohydrolase
MPALISWWTHDIAGLSPEADPLAVAATGADLLRRWTEAHRRYHSTRHLVELFRSLEELEEAAEIGAVEATTGRIAAWLHDAVSDPHARPGGNEAASAELAATVLARVDAPADVVATVQAVIRMTDGHGSDDGQSLTRAFHDSDLWILSAPERRFDEYCAQVREEYAHVPDVIYRAARSTILADFVRRDPLYLTAYGQQQWDDPARANLSRELRRLA